MLINPFDFRVLSILGRFRFVPTSELAKCLADGKSVESVYPYLSRRLKHLREQGLVERIKVMDRSFVHYLSAHGADVMHIEGGSNVGVKLREYEHDLALVHLCVALETVHGKRLVTEREVRSLDPSPVTNEYALKVTRQSGKSGWSWPDLISIEADVRTAYEVEWTRKSKRRLLMLMHAYGYSHTFHYAVYFTNDYTHEWVSKCAKEANDQLFLRGLGRPIAVRRLDQFISVAQRRAL